MRREGESYEPPSYEHTYLLGQARWYLGVGVKADKAIRLIARGSGRKAAVWAVAKATKELAVDMLPDLEAEAKKRKATSTGGNQPQAYAGGAKGKAVEIAAQTNSPETTSAQTLEVAELVAS